jgi:hypothetical protein
MTNVITRSNHCFDFHSFPQSQWYQFFKFIDKINDLNKTLQKLIMQYVAVSDLERSMNFDGLSNLNIFCCVTKTNSLSFWFILRLTKMFKENNIVYLGNAGFIFQARRFWLNLEDKNHYFTNNFQNIRIYFMQMTSSNKLLLIRYAMLVKYSRKYTNLTKT